MEIRFTAIIKIIQITLITSATKIEIKLKEIKFKYFMVCAAWRLKPFGFGNNSYDSF